tara:strand:+ start:1518 stop:2462 length:945 start_codon:yes stop_codon:yes gene_type:complete
VKILVTGGVGLLSTRIVNFLSEQGYEVLLVSRNIKNILFLKNKKTKIQKINWDSQKNLEKTCHNIDLIIHCAGINSQESQLSPFDCYLFNTKIFNNFLRAAIKKKVKKFILISSVHVYNSKLTGKITENSKTNNQHPYAVGKLLSEEILLNSIKYKKIKGLVLRLSNVVGAPLKKETNCKSLIVNDFSIQFFKKNEIKIKSNPNIKRNYITMNDFLNVLLIIIIKNTKVYESNILNLVSNTHLSINRILSLVCSRIEKIYKIQPKILFLTNLKKIENLKFDNKRVKKINYIFKNNFKVEIDQILKFYQNKYYDK